MSGPDRNWELLCCGDARKYYIYFDRENGIVHIFRALYRKGKRVGWRRVTELFSSDFMTIAGR